MRALADADADRREYAGETVALLIDLPIVVGVPLVPGNAIVERFK